MAFYLRATRAGAWKSALVLDPITGEYHERALAVATERGTWTVDNRAVVVEPGLIVGFRDATAAEWFCERNRARPVKAEIGLCFAFENEADRDYVISQKNGEAVGQAEAEADRAMRRSQKILAAI